MRIGATALAVVVCWALTAGAADDEKYTSKEGKFTIQFPKGAKVKTETKKSADGNELHMTATAEGKEKLYMVMYGDLPETVKNVPPKTFFDAAEKGGVERSKGKLVSSKDIEFGKNKLPGREFVVEKDGNKIRSRTVLVDTRLYTVIVGGAKDFATTKEATSFLDSFEITK